MNSAGRDRTDTSDKGHWILSPTRLPIPPQRLELYLNHIEKGGSRI